MNYSLQKRNIDSVDENWLRSEYKSGRSAQNIGDELGCSKTKILRLLRKYGIDRRKFNEPGESRHKDITGMRSGKLVAIKYLKTTAYHNKPVWLCKCDCGNEVEVISNSITTRHTKSCGCLYGEARKRHYRDQWVGEINNTIWNTIKRSAKARGLEFSLTRQYIWDLFTKQEKTCPLSGRTLIMKENASLDRIDNSLGYIEGNVRWVDRYVNLMRNKFETQQFIDVCRDVYLFTNCQEPIWVV